MSEEKSAPQQGAKYAKGDRAAVVDGRQGVGTRGEVFWVGENKYGPGMRYGLRGDDGATYWLEETQIGSEKDAPEPPPKPARGAVKALDRGARVEITNGKGKGQTGDVFWVGESKYGDGMRYGVKSGDDETFWVDDHEVKELEGAKQEPRQASPQQGASAGELPPEAFGGGDELPPEAYEGDGEQPPEAYEGSAEPPPEGFSDELPPEAYEE
jgi:hypothetical protein